MPASKPRIHQYSNARIARYDDRSIGIVRRSDGDYVLVFRRMLGKKPGDARNPSTHRLWRGGKVGELNVLISPQAKALLAQMLELDNTTPLRKPND